MPTYDAARHIQDACLCACGCHVRVSTLAARASHLGYHIAEGLPPRRDRCHRRAHAFEDPRSSRRKNRPLVSSQRELEDEKKVFPKSWRLPPVRLCAARKSQRGVDGTARRGWLHRMSFSHSAYSTMNTNAAREILMPKRMPTSKGATSSHTANVALRKNKGKFATSMGPEVSLTRDSPLCCCTACSSATARTHGHGGRV